MLQRDRDDCQAEQLERGGNFGRIKERSIAGPFVFLEDVTESLEQDIEGGAGGKTGDYLFMKEVEAAQVINAVDMIGVGMGEEYGVDPVDIVAERLAAQVGGGIDQDIPVFVADEERGAGALVSFVIR